jgi:hypothetical protein
MLKESCVQTPHYHRTRQNRDARALEQPARQAALDEPTAEPKPGSRQRKDAEVIRTRDDMRHPVLIERVARMGVSREERAKQDRGARAGRNEAGTKGGHQVGGCFT